MASLNETVSLETTGYIACKIIVICLVYQHFLALHCL